MEMTLWDIPVEREAGTARAVSRRMSCLVAYTAVGYKGLRRRSLLCITSWRTHNEIKKLSPEKNKARNTEGNVCREILGRSQSCSGAKRLEHEPKSA